MHEKDSRTGKNAQEYDAHAESWHASVSTNMSHKYLEKPAMGKELPDTLEGKNVLCIGVGSGDELQEILKHNPEHIIGIDISSELLNIAKGRFPNVEFKKVDMTTMDFPNESFDFVYSSLTFHYAKDWDVLCSEIYRVLKKGGELLFSTHNPEYWSRQTTTGNVYKNARGITLTEHTAVLPGDVSIVYYNHPSTDSICDAVKYAGFEIEKSFAPFAADIAEDLIPQEDREEYQKLKIKNSKLPRFFIVKALKK